jgi:hypothetical protein
MAYVTGVATNHLDLWAKLKTFLTTNADLIAAEQQWDLVWADTDSTDYVLRGPGLSGQDQVYVGFHQNIDPGRDSYWLEINGMTGVLPTAPNVAGHVKPTLMSNGAFGSCRMFADPNPMTYWFVANGRRFVCVVKISTVFQTLYGGLFLPFATPLSYPYPLFIGGSTSGLAYGAGGEDAVKIYNWRSTDLGHSHFTQPDRRLWGADTLDGGAYFLAPENVWRNIATRGELPDYTMAPDWVPPAFGVDQWVGWLYPTTWVRDRARECFGGQYLLTPCTIMKRDPNPQTYGVLDGVYRVQGFSNSAENIVTIDGVDHLVVQNAFRTAISEFWALRLE